jgi:formylglycine-generating enzyme required for sulfatase activity
MKPKGRRMVLSTGAVAVLAFTLVTYLSWPHIVFWYQFGCQGGSSRPFANRSFWMGAQKADPKGQNYDPEAQDNEGPVHEVTLSPFLIGKYEVTQAQWKLVMGSNPSYLKGEDDHPVKLVSWYDVKEFGAKTGLRLPTEAHWEYACRGGSSTPIAGGGNLNDMGWYSENNWGTTHPVGKKSAYGFGLHDMHGNVGEWCEEVYDAEFFSKPEALVKDPISRGVSVYRFYRVIRGLPDDAGYCSSASRTWSAPWDPDHRLGFSPGRLLR